MSPTIRRLCPGCKVVLITAPTRRCAACAKAYEQGRGTRQARGYDGRHARWRRMVLATYRTCCDCGAPGQADDHADHLVALAAGGSWELENGRRRCHRCHSRKTVLTDGGFGRPRGSAGPSQGDSEGAGKEVQRDPPGVPWPSFGSTDGGTAYVREEDDGA